MKIWILSVIERKIEEPYLKLLKLQPSNIGFNQELVKIFPNFEKCIADPTNFFFGEEEIFPQMYSSKVPLSPPPTDVSPADVIEKWLKPVLQAGLEALKTHTADFLPNGKFSSLSPERQEELKCVLATTNIAESVFGLLTHLKQKYAAAKEKFLHHLVQLKDNGISLALARHVCEKYPEAVEFIQKECCHQKSWQSDLQEGITKEQKKQEEEEERKLAKRQAKQEKLAMLDTIPFIWSEGELKVCSKDVLKNQCRKHKLVGFSSWSKEMILNELFGHIYPSRDECFCTEAPYSFCSPDLYQGYAEIWFVDIEANTIGAVMQFCAIEMITGTEFKSFVRVSIGQKQKY